MEFNLEWAKERARQAASGEKPITRDEVSAALREEGMRRRAKPASDFDLDAALRSARAKGSASMAKGADGDVYFWLKQATNNSFQERQNVV